MHYDTSRNLATPTKAHLLLELLIIQCTLWQVLFNHTLLVQRLHALSTILQLHLTYLTTTGPALPALRSLFVYEFSIGLLAFAVGLQIRIIIEADFFDLWLACLRLI